LKSPPPEPRLAAATCLHVWQKRFYDFNVSTAGKRIEKLR
jgi:hypothetical protein